MTARLRWAAVAVALAWVAVVAFVAVAPPATAGGSDDPAPYTVTAQGVYLPDGVVFPAHGHVNFRTTLRSGGVHFDPNNNHPGGVYIGQAFFPIELAPGECITWVQVSLYDEHFGEGGQDPVCRPTDPTPGPTPTVDPTPTPEPTQEPTWTPTPTEPSTPSPTSDVEPSTPSSEATETPTTDASPEPSTESASPAPTRSPAPGASPVLLETVSTPSTGPSLTPSAVTPGRSSSTTATSAPTVLPVTGPSGEVLLFAGFGLTLLAIGTLAVAVGRKRP